MTMLKSLPALVLLATAAVAQSAAAPGQRTDPGVPSQAGEPVAERELRRAALRAALRPRQVPQAVLLPPAAPDAVPRRLTPTERAELRQQLRLQQRDNAGPAR
ncbi:MAG: hypothetical protein IPO43_09260 [Rhodoferax sp.]|jgi:hypothetical protein|nr:hypothetical protein [Rhodoferax sp.]